MADRPRNYAEFWPYYLKEHADPRTRLVHYMGSALAIAALIAAFATLDWRWFLAAMVAGYAFAWFAHFRIERNRPATFTYPVWSLVSDFRMFALWVVGRLQPHLDRSLQH